jgi:hypothetical protein
MVPDDDAFTPESSQRLQEHSTSDLPTHHMRVQVSAARSYNEALRDPIRLK